MLQTTLNRTRQKIHCLVSRESTGHAHSLTDRSSHWLNKEVLCTLSIYLYILISVYTQKVGWAFLTPGFNFRASEHIRIDIQL
jgi:hypothetical protein